MWALAANSLKLLKLTALGLRPIKETSSLLHRIGSNNRSLTEVKHLSKTISVLTKPDDSLFNG
jgi:hypothetical protein